TMKTMSLLVVLVLAKGLVLVGRQLTWSWWAPIAYLWQDALVVLLFAVIELATRRRSWIAWCVYLPLLLYVALNVVVARVLSTPITWMMLRATGSTLADSILHYATWTNLLMLTIVLVVGIGMPLLLRTRPTRRLHVRATLAGVLIGLVVI